VHGNILVSFLGHIALILVMAFGLPSFFQPEETGLTANSVGIISEVQLAELKSGGLPPPKDAKKSKTSDAKTRPTPAAKSKEPNSANSPRSAPTSAKKSSKNAKANSSAASPTAKAAPRPLPPKRSKSLEAKKPKPEATKTKPPKVAARTSTEKLQTKKPAPVPPRRTVEAKLPQKPAPKPQPPKPAVKPMPKENADDAFANLIGGAIGVENKKDDMSAIADALGVGVSSGPLSNTIQQAIASRLGMCWTPLKGAPGAEDLIVEVRIRLLPTSEVDQVEIVKRPPGQFGNVAAQRAEQAVRKCNPFNKSGILTLPLNKYRDWREMRITFDPRKYTG
jgi:hypothetical protein